MMAATLVAAGLRAGCVRYGGVAQVYQRHFLHKGLPRSTSSSEGGSDKGEGAQAGQEVTHEVGVKEEEELLSTKAEKVGDRQVASSREVKVEQTGRNDEAGEVPQEQTEQTYRDDKQTKREAAQKKLNSLLTSLATKEPILVEPVVRLTRPKPRPRRTPRDTSEDIPEHTNIDPELVSATKEVAESLGGDTQATESELLSTLRLHSTESPAPDKPATNLSELFVGMKVERKASKSEGGEEMAQKRYDRRADPRWQSEAPSYHHRPSLQQPSKKPMSRTMNRVNLFEGKRLGIFSKADGTEGEEKPLLPVWDELHRRELELTISQPPENALVEMIQWTNQGKLWTFPIDNEIGLEEEKSVGFHEHVFLERHLAGWCPSRGPIRHFMELVCTGLSKNPYLTVERKRAHIEWYRNYFAEKESVLKEIGAIESSQ